MREFAYSMKVDVLNAEKRGIRRGTARNLWEDKTRPHFLWDLPDHPPPLLDRLPHRSEGDLKRRNRPETTNHRQEDVSFV